MPRQPPRFIRALFDEMRASCGLVNLISSFNFARRWRTQWVAMPPAAFDFIVCATGLTGTRPLPQGDSC